jgi:4-alpha-glucanotransferase
MSDSALARLANAAGLLIDWEDAGGVQRTVTDDSLRAILGGLDLACGSGAQCAESIAGIENAPVPDFLTAEAGRGFALPGVSGLARLTLENGASSDFMCDAGMVPPIDAPGYHRIEAGGREWTVAVAPAHGALVAGRPWGTAVQLYGLCGDAGEGFGHFGLLAEFARAAGREGADAVAISPVHALFTADPGRYSPYGPSSRVALNPIFVDPDGASGEQAPDDLIQWRTAWPARMVRLRAAYRALAGPAAEAFARFEVEADEKLRLHALFEALHGHFFERKAALGWQDWPDRFRDPGSDAVSGFAADHADEVRFHLYCQWRADRGLADAHAAAREGGMRIGLVTDIAVGLDPGGSEGWAARDELLMGLSIGGPPDAYQAAGQNWGITGLSPMALRKSGFRPFIALLRAAMRHAGGVRIDHALGLRRLWLVPRGASPLEGAYLRCAEQDMLRLIALESMRNDAIAIGEDLGVVPAGFRPELAERAILGMRVLPFERTPDGGFTSSSGWDRAAVAMTSTHDMTPIAGWWRGVDLDWRKALGSDDPVAEPARARERTALWDACIAAGVADGPEPPADQPLAALDAATSLTAQSACTLAIVPAEDLFALEEAPNLPGTVHEHPNWRRRLPAGTAALFDRPDVRHRTALLRKARPA